jgi:hypothetical protein
MLPCRDEARKKIRDFVATAIKQVRIMLYVLSCVVVWHYELLWAGMDILFFMTCVRWGRKGYYLFWGHV